MTITRILILLTIVFRWQNKSFIVFFGVALCATLGFFLPSTMRQSTKYIQCDILLTIFIYDKLSFFSVFVFLSSHADDLTLPRMTWFGRVEAHRIAHCLLHLNRIKFVKSFNASIKFLSATSKENYLKTLSNILWLHYFIRYLVKFNLLAKKKKNVTEMHVVVFIAQREYVI